MSKNLHKPNEQNMNNKPTILLRSSTIYINIVRRIARLFPKIRYYVKLVIHLEHLVPFPHKKYPGITTVKI